VPADYKEMRPVKAYFVKDLNADRIKFADQAGPAAPRGERGEAISIQFSDFLCDVVRKKAMVHAVVTEDRRSQHVWVMVVHTSKGWCIAPADGTAILPTEGVQRAVELVYEAALRSGQ
jgi:hypothetical protein